MADPSSVVVVGAGVSGLTTAVALSRAGFDVQIVSADRPEDTTSLAAGAVWGPYLVEPLDKVQQWSAKSLEVFDRLAIEEPSSGVHITSGIEASRTPQGPPAWAGQLRDFRMCEPDELPDGFVTGWHFAAPTIDMPVYLRYLEQQLIEEGVRIEIQPALGSLEDLAELATLIVNCSGSGARDLVGDNEVTAIKGHLVVLENPGLTDFFSEETGNSSDLLHYAPHGKTVVLGGIAQDGNWSTSTDLELGQAIIDRCSSVEPLLNSAPLIEHRIGLRPTRPLVRVEIDQTPSPPVIHNYGHGGAGVTLSWGCAEAVTKLAAGTTDP